MSRRPSMDSWGNRLYTGEVSYDFVGRRRLWYAIALAVVLLSLLALLLRGFNTGIEFRGGSEFRVSNIAGEVDQGLAEDLVRDVDPGSQPRVSVVGGDSIRVQTGELGEADTSDVRAGLAEAYDVEPTEIGYDLVGPSWGQDVSQRAVQALLVFLALVAVAIALYFRTWKMAVAALVALIHDVIATVGVYALVGFEVTPASVIGFLTILGYSLYDTVVVFDKVRENTEHITESQTQTFGEAANLAVNQTLIRSINTSIVALLPVAAILFIGSFVLGAGTLQDLSLALFVGMALGTYSSIFIATPLLAHLREREPAMVEQANRVRARRARTPGGDAGIGTGATAGELAVVGQAPMRQATTVPATEAGALAAPLETGTGIANGASRYVATRPPGSGGQRVQPRRGRRR